MPRFNDFNQRAQDGITKLSSISSYLIWMHEHTDQDALDITSDCERLISAEHGICSYDHIAAWDYASKWEATAHLINRARIDALEDCLR